MIKESLNELGEQRGYDVSESEKEIFLVSERFSDRDFELVGKGSRLVDFGKTRRKPHTFSYKPDCVWKKGRFYIAIFEVEHLKKGKKVTEKRKYSIGSFMLGFLAYIQKSAKYFIFITDNTDLYQEIITFKRLLPFKHDLTAHVLFIGTLRGRPLNRPNMRIALEETLFKKWKI